MLGRRLVCCLSFFQRIPTNLLEAEFLCTMETFCRERGWTEDTKIVVWRNVSLMSTEVALRNSIIPFCLPSTYLPDQIGNGSGCFNGLILIAGGGLSK